MSNWEHYHHATCNYPHAPIGYPGCICLVVNRHEQERQEALIGRLRAVLANVMGYVDIEDFSAHSVEACRESMKLAEKLLIKGSPSTSETPREAMCEECDGSGESGHTHTDGTQYSIADPPCPACGGSGKTSSGEHS
ncbi:MAG: hypothetical protein ACRDFB_10570 [Rhabdochlamydiaceae bacterium]